MSPWGHRAARAREVISNVCRTRRKAKIDQAEEAEEEEDEEEETTVVAVVIETPVAEVAGIVATANVLVVETTVVAVTTETAEATTAAVTTAEAEAMAVTTAAVMTGDVAVMTAAETIGAGMVAGMVAAMAAVIAAVMGAVMGAVAVIAGIVVIDQEVSERVAAEKAERADQNHPKNSFHSPKAWKPQNTVKGVRKLWVFMARLQQKLCSQEPNVFVVSCRQTFRR